MMVDSPACSLDGQCESNPEYMQATCPLSCRVCEHNCTDTSDDCSFWARTGECENNTAFMLRKCPTACGLCTPKCVDTHGGYESGPSANETMCEKWARQGDCEGAATGTNRPDDRGQKSGELSARSLVCVCLQATRTMC